MAGWETQSFERGWGGTGRTFLSHYKRLEPLGKHPPGPPARSPGPAALLLPRADAALGGRRLIPDPHHGWRAMRCPERGSLSPRCCGWPQIATCVGCRWPQAAESPCAVAGAGLRARRRRERGAWRCRGVVCNSVRCSLPCSLGRWGELQLLGAFSSNRTLQPLPHLAEGHRGVDQPQSKAPFHHPAAHLPISASALPQCLINLSVLPLISELLSKSGLVDTWK